MEARVYIVKNGERRMAWYSIEEGYMFLLMANSDTIS